MKRLVFVIILLAIVFVNNCFSETIGPDQQLIDKIESHVSAFKNMPVVKEGLASFDKQFVNCIMYFPRYPKMHEQSVNNPRFDWVATFKVRQILTAALADQKSNVRVVNWKNYKGFSIQIGDGTESLGLLFDVDGNSAFLSDYVYIGGQIERMSPGEKVLAVKMLFNTLDVCATRAKKSLKK